MHFAEEIILKLICKTDRVPRILSGQVCDLNIAQKGKIKKQKYYNQREVVTFILFHVVNLYETSYLGQTRILTRLVKHKSYNSHEAFAPLSVTDLDRMIYCQYGGRKELFLTILFCCLSKFKPFCQISIHLSYHYSSTFQQFTRIRTHFWEPLAKTILHLLSIIQQNGNS